MVPLALFNAWPVVGCICADGSYKPNCPALRDHARSAATASTCCALAQNDKVDSPKSVHACCQDEPAEPPATADDERVCGKSCCHLVVESPTPSILLVSVKIDLGHDVLTSTTNILDSPSFASNTPWQTIVENDTGQAGCDLVITLKRLII
jgi:hypothetical protein